MDGAEADTNREKRVNPKFKFALQDSRASMVITIIHGYFTIYHVFTSAYGSVDGVLFDLVWFTIFPSGTHQYLD